MPTELTEELAEETVATVIERKMDRATFLKLTGLASLALVSLGIPQRVVEATQKLVTQRKHRWGMAIDLIRCVNCKACTLACKLENKTPPGVVYNPVVEEEVGEFPNVKRRWYPKPCFHCENPPCTKVCPVTATYKRPSDGIVIVDYDQCIGCRYCITACPYGARYFDFGENYHEGKSQFAQIPSPEFGGEYGLRREGRSPIGNVRKCTFCLHLQDENGEYSDSPACARTCMGRAIHFGDFATESEGRCLVHGCDLKKLIVARNWIRLKEELGTEPNVYYLV